MTDQMCQFALFSPTTTVFMSNLGGAHGVQPASSRNARWTNAQRSKRGQYWTPRMYLNYLGICTRSELQVLRVRTRGKWPGSKAHV